VIPEAAVEAAVAILRQPDFWEYGDEEATRAMLEAAAPHMMAQGWNEGVWYAASLLNAEELAVSFRKGNPYR